MKDEINVSWSLCIVAHKVLITRWPLVFRVAGQHALQANAHALDIVDGRPSLTIEEVKANDAIGIYVRMYGDWVGFIADKNNFGGLLI